MRVAPRTEIRFDCWRRSDEQIGNNAQRTLMGPRLLHDEMTGHAARDEHAAIEAARRRGVVRQRSRSAKRETSPGHLGNRTSAYSFRAPIMRSKRSSWSRTTGFFSSCFDPAGRMCATDDSTAVGIAASAELS